MCSWCLVTGGLMNHAYGSQRTMRGRGMGAANLAELTAVGPSGTLLCYSCTPRAREVQPPTLTSSQPWVAPDSQSCSPVYPTGSLTLKPPLWAQLGLWVSCTTLHRSRTGKNQCPVSCRLNFLAQLPRLLETDFLNVGNSWKKFLLDSKGFLRQLK